MNAIKLNNKNLQKFSKGKDFPSIMAAAKSPKM